jgi:hypothetical protein
MDDGHVDPTKATAYWHSELEKKGAQESVALLRAQAQMLSFAQAHVLAHAFGDALYDLEGADGLPVCPSEFSQGCAHELIGRAVVEHGLGAMESLSRSCAMAGTSQRVCMHSLGHGILGSFGYDDASLTSALEVCRAHDPGARSSCADGVFMEYFLRFLAAGAGDDSFIRPFDEAHPYGPCESVETTYSAACGFELPRWKQYFESAASASEEFGDLGAYCSGAPDGRIRRGCWEGIGALASIETGPDTSASLTLCASTAAGTAYLYCVTGIVLHQHYWNTPGYERVCDGAGLSEGALAYCRTYAHTDVEEVDAIPLYRGR